MIKEFRTDTFWHLAITYVAVLIVVSMIFLFVYGLYVHSVIDGLSAWTWFHLLLISSLGFYYGIGLLADSAPHVYQYFLDKRGSDDTD